jgi:hypothetical protein
MASNWFAQNSPPTPGVSSPQALEQTPPASQPQGSAQGDYQAEFQQAVKDLGIDPGSFRGNPAVMDKVTNYLNQKYPGQNWTNGGARAGDWVSANGQGFDVLPAGDRNWQWLSDPANSTAGNPNDPSGFQTGTFTGGGQYPLAAVNGTGLSQPWTTPFQAPDNITEQNDPGFQARLKMGTDAIQRSAASRGTLLTGGLLKGLDRYAQDYASNEYGNVYNRALGQYQQAYDIFNNNGNTLFNRLSALGSVGENAAAGVGNAQIGAGDARAQGAISQGQTNANAYGQYGNIANNAFQYYNQYHNPQYQNPYIANNAGYNPNGVNQTGVTMIPPTAG